MNAPPSLQLFPSALVVNVSRSLGDDSRCAVTHVCASLGAALRVFNRPNVRFQLLSALSESVTVAQSGVEIGGVSPSSAVLWSCPAGASCVKIDSPGVGTVTLTNLVFSGRAASASHATLPSQPLVISRLFALALRAVTFRDFAPLLPLPRLAQTSSASLVQLVRLTDVALVNVSTAQPALEFRGAQSVSVDGLLVDTLLGGPALSVSAAQQVTIARVAATDVIAGNPGAAAGLLVLSDVQSAQLSAFMVDTCVGPAQGQASCVAIDSVQRLSLARLAFVGVSSVASGAAVRVSNSAQVAVTQLSCTVCATTAGSGGALWLENVAAASLTELDFAQCSAAVRSRRSSRL